MLNGRDGALYLLTAEALEKHSLWLASLPPAHAAGDDPARYRPVNLIV